MVFLTFVNLVRNRGPDHFWRRHMWLRLSAKYYGRKQNCYSIAIRYAHRALRYSTLARKLKKKSMLQLWTTRITAGCREHGMEYSTFMNGLNESHIALNRKTLADLVIYEPRTFQSLVQIVEDANKDEGLKSALAKLPPGIFSRGMMQS